MNNLLITQLNHKKKKKSKKKEEVKSEKEKKKKSSYFLVKNDKKYSKTKLELMNYLVDEQARYTNLDKAVDYYQNKIESYKRQMNKNEELIQKKQIILNSLISQLNDILIKNFQPIDNENAQNQENKRMELEIQIQTYTQALDMYQNIKSELQNENILLKKDLKKEYKESLSRKKQYDNYIIIKNKIQNEEKTQEHLLNTMTNFDVKSKSMFDKEETKKKNTLAKEEFSLNELKQSMRETEEHLIKLEKKIIRRQKILPFEKRRNYKIYQDNKILIKEKVANFLKLHLIQKIHKLHSLEEVFVHVKQQNLVFQSKYNKINRMLSDLTNLKHTISKDQQEIKSIQELIKEKLESEGIIYDDPQLIKKLVLINGEKESNVLSIEKAYKKENLIKGIIRFMERYYYQFEKMIKSTLVFYLKIKEKTISKNELENIFNLFSNNENINEIRKYSSTKAFALNDYKNVIKILMQFFRKVTFIYCNFIIDIAIQASNSEEKINENEKNEKEGNEKMKIIVFSSLTKEIEEEEKERQFGLKESLNKNKKLTNNQKKQELLKQNISKEINYMLDQGIDIEVLLERYLTALRKRNDEKNKVKKKDKFEYETLKEKKRNEKKRKIYEKENKRIRETRLLFDKLKMKFFLDLTNYTSELVKHDDWDKKNKTKYNIDIRLVNRKKNTKNVLSELLQEYNRNKVQKKFNIGLSQVFKNIVKRGRAQRAIHFPKQKNEFEEIQVLDDTFIDENEYNKHPDVEIEKKIIKIQKNFFGYKSGNTDKKNNSFRTMFDLHKINLELFHKKSGIENYKDFDTIQNEFQKKLNMKIYSPIVSNFIPKREYCKKNRFVNYVSSDNSINNNNFTTSLTNRGVNRENKEEANNGNHTSSLQKKKKLNYPIIKSGNITVTE